MTIRFYHLSRVQPKVNKMELLPIQNNNIQPQMLIPTTISM